MSPAVAFSIRVSPNGWLQPSDSTFSGGFRSTDRATDENSRNQEPGIRIQLWARSQESGCRNQAPQIAESARFDARPDRRICNFPESTRRFLNKLERNGACLSQRHDKN